MTDRELLELAAKAANLNIANQKDGEVQLEQYIQKSYKLESGEFWNPLTDDGDAMRLAVKLSLHVRVMRRTIMVEKSELGDDTLEPIENNPYAATRRAIVRVAAQIGKTL